MVSESFAYEKNKVIQALRYHFISRTEIKVMIILVNVFAITAAAFYFMKQINPLAFMASSLFWFFLMFTFWFLLPYSIYKKEKTFRDIFIVALNNETFELRNERSQREWDWRDFSHYMETPHFFHLYFSARAFFLIPKSAFGGDAEHEARQLLNSVLPKK